MMDMLIVSQIGHAIVALTFGLFVLASYRYVLRRSTVVGAIFGITILVRTAMGLALFWISYLQLPIAESLQLSGGFWQLFLDATGNYPSAASAAEAHTFVGLDHEVPSPFYVNTLALWMMAVGVSPAAGFFLNLCLYVAFVRLVVWFFAPVNDWRPDLPCIVGVAAYSFCPVILIHSTQPLKDELAGVLVALMCFGVLVLMRLLRRDLVIRHLRSTIAPLAAVAAAIFGMAGIRWYFAFMMWCALALALAIFAVRGRTTPLPRYLTGSFAVLVAAWLAFWAGAGPYYRILAPDLDSVFGPSRAGAFTQLAGLPSKLIVSLQAARTGFLRSGGGTNVVIPLRNGRAAAPSPAAAAAPSPAVAPAPSQAAAAATSEANVRRAIPVNISEQIKATTWGLAAIFVPISLVTAVAGVEVAGGRGLLHVTDVDTLILDVGTLFVLTLLWRRRHLIGDRLPIVVSAAILSAASAVLLGYTVTNFGTLWRMRPMIAIPLWALVVALSPRSDAPCEAAGARHRAPVTTEH